MQKRTLTINLFWLIWYILISGDFAYAHAPVGVLSTVTSGWGSEDTGNVCVIFEAFVTGTESTTEDVHVNVNVNTEIKGNRNISQTVELNGNGR